MKGKLTFLCICAWIVSVALTGCAKHQSSTDRTISVSEDDATMNAAIAKARGSLPQFWEIFNNPANGELDFCLKVKISDGEEVEHFWVIDINRKDGKISGTINNDPDVVHNVKNGQRIAINEADISDWLYMRNGKMVGNFTLRALFDKMPKGEVEKMKRILADP